MTNDVQPAPAAPQPPAVPVLPDGRFEGRKQFQQLLRDALELAAMEGWPEILLCDASFADWPLAERSVDESLRRWSKTGRKLTLLARRYDALMQRHDRFVTYRRDWAHIIDCRACPSIDAGDFPSALWSPVWVLDRLDPVRSVGVAGHEPERRLSLRERLDECLLRSSASFPASVAGL